MNTAALVSAIRQTGVRLIPEGGKIHLRPPGKLPPDLRAALKASKPEVLRLLARESSNGDAALLAADACVECGSRSWVVSLVDDAMNRVCHDCLSGKTAICHAGVPA